MRALEGVLPEAMAAEVMTSEAVAEEAMLPEAMAAEAVTSEAVPEVPVSPEAMTAEAVTSEAVAAVRPTVIKIGDNIVAMNRETGSRCGQTA